MTFFHFINVIKKEFSGGNKLKMYLLALKYISKGLYNYKGGNYFKAIQYYTEAGYLFPEIKIAYYLRAFAKLCVRDYRGALIDLHNSYSEFKDLNNEIQITFKYLHSWSSEIPSLCNYYQFLINQLNGFVIQFDYGDIYGYRFKHYKQKNV
jgi:hypothetical protein